MKRIIFLFFTSLCHFATVSNDIDVSNTNNEMRRSLLSGFHDRCYKMEHVFKCMTHCKSLGYEMYRLNYKCECRCFDHKTTKLLPIFITKGTTATLPRTFSVSLYMIAGTLSPRPSSTVATTQAVTNKSVECSTPLTTTTTTTTTVATTHAAEENSTVETTTTAETTVASVASESTAGAESEASAADAGGASEASSAGSTAAAEGGNGSGGGAGNASEAGGEEASSASTAASEAAPPPA